MLIILNLQNIKDGQKKLKSETIILAKNVAKLVDI